MIPNLNKVKLPFLEREKRAIPEIEFRCVFVFIHPPRAWTLDFAFTFNAESILCKKWDTDLDGFEKWKKEFFFRKFRSGKQDFFSFTKRK